MSDGFEVVQDDIRGAAADLQEAVVTGDLSGSVAYVIPIDPQEMVR